MATDFISTSARENNGRPNWIRIVTVLLTLFIGVLGFLIFRNILHGPIPRTDLERDLLLAQQGVDRFPKKAEPHNDLGAVYARMGIDGKAETEFKTAIKLRPKLTLAHFNLALLYKKQQRWAPAEKEFKRAVELTPNFETAMFKLGEVYIAKKEPRKAIALYQKALKYRPDAADTLVNQGKAYEAVGDVDRASENYKQALKFIPDYQEAKAALAALEKKGK